MLTNEMYFAVCPNNFDLDDYEQNELTDMINESSETPNTPNTPNITNIHNIINDKRIKPSGDTRSIASNEVKKIHSKKYNYFKKDQQIVINSFVKFILENNHNKRIEQKQYARMLHKHPKFTNVSFNKIYFTLKNRLVKMKKKRKLITKAHSSKASI